MQNLSSAAVLNGALRVKLSTLSPITFNSLHAGNFSNCVLLILFQNEHFQKILNGMDLPDHVLIWDQTVIKGYQLTTNRYACSSI